MSTTPSAAGPFTISRDGKPVATAADEFELLRWFHRNHSYSAAHAVRWEGYKITDANGENVEV